MTRVRLTSLEAFNAIKATGALDAAQWKTYEYLFVNGPCTGGELNVALGQGEGNPSYHRRARELVHTGCVAETGKRECKTSGRNAVLYDVTTALPSKEKLAEAKSKRSKPSRKVLAVAVSEITEMCRYLRAHRQQKYSAEFLETYRWLKALAEEKPKVPKTPKPAADAAAPKSTP